MAPVVGIGGVLSEQIQWGYYSLLLSGPDSGLPSKERFFSIPDGGRAPIDETYGQLEEDLLETHERVGEPMVIWGHSYGGLMATLFALNHPDKTSAVENLASIHDGVDEFTFSGRALKKVMGNPGHAEDLLRESDFMTAHRRIIATKWPSHVPLQLISPTFDILIPAPHGLEVALPRDQEAEKLIVVPRIPGLYTSIREKTAHLENVRELRPWLPVGHITLPLSPSVIANTRGLRRAAAANKPEITLVAKTTSTPMRVPIAA
jgi:pimeloyl-ACP methyl ester carboxylesterase